MSACPVCSKSSVERYRPFCSRRCANVDLGRWLNGEYRIPGEPADETELAAAENRTDARRKAEN